MTFPSMASHSGDFDDLKDLQDRSLEGARRGTIACVYP